MVEDLIQEAMNAATNRGLSTFGGVSLSAVALTFVAIAGIDAVSSPVIAVVVASFLTAGIAGTLAAVDSRFTRIVGWRRLAGLGLLAVGVGIAAGTRPLLAAEAVDPVFVGVAALSVVAAVAVSLDLIVFDGRHVDPSDLSRIERAN